MAQNDVLKRYIDAGLEFGLVTQARAEALVRELVKVGEVQADQAREAVSDLVGRSRRNSEKLLDTVRKEVRSQVTERGLVSKGDLDKLEARIAKVVGSATAAVKKAPAKKKAAAKKAPAKKKAAAKKAPAKKRS